MKKVFLFLILCCTLMVVSCSQLNNGGKSKAELLIGKWLPVKIEEFDKDGNLVETYSGEVSSDVTFTDSVIYITGEDGTEGVHYTFDEDNQWIVYGEVILIVTKLTKDELVLIDDMSTYKKGKYGWDVIYLKKVK